VSNYYFEDIPNTPFGILVLPSILGGYQWFITNDDEDALDSEQPIIKCNSTLASPYEAVDDALSTLNASLSMWMVQVAEKRRDWLKQQ
jgi:hypothetical protein